MICNLKTKNFGVARCLSFIILMVALLFIAAGASVGQTPADVSSLIENGKRELQAARSTDTAEAYAKAEATFTEAMKLAPKSGVALLYRGVAKLSRSGWLARHGRYVESTPLMNDGVADMNAAVALSHDDIDVRMMRGTSYAQFPAFMNKGALAREDLEAVVRHTKFASLEAETRAGVYLTLGRVYAASGQPDKARESWRAALASSPQGKAGAAAKEELDKLKEPAIASDPAGRRMPDRFPKVSADTSPIMVAASVTFPQQAGGWRRTALPKSMLDFLDKLARQPGLLGVHLLSSMDHEGMLVIVTWWENKKALNDWFYSETHQRIIREYYGGGARCSNSSNSAVQAQQTSAEGA